MGFMYTARGYSTPYANIYSSGYITLNPIITIKANG